MATAAPTSLGAQMAQIREELCCSICLELFTRPKSHVGAEVFKCPNCRRQITLPHKGVRALPDNHIVASLCERLQSQALLSGGAREQPQCRDRCHSHPSEEIKLFCKQCDEPVCNECLDEMHSDHVTISLKKATQEKTPPVQALIDEGRNILDAYYSFLGSLREKEKGLSEQKQLTDNSIIQVYNQTVQKLGENKNHLLSGTQKNHDKNREELQNERDEVLADVSELSAACDEAEQQMEQGGVEFHSQEAILTEVVGKYRAKPTPTPTQPRTAVFEPTDTPVPGLGHIIFKPAPFLISGHQTIALGRLGSKTATGNTPLGVTVSNEGEIFVADLGTKRIQVFTMHGTFVRQFPITEPCGLGMESLDIAMGRNGVWVVGVTCLKLANFAVLYSKQGRVLNRFDLLQTGCERGVAVDTRRNHVLITQTVVEDWARPRGEVLVFEPDGRLVRTVDGKPRETGLFASIFRQPRMKRLMYISVDGDADGRILVSDWDNHCVFVYNVFGQHQLTFGEEGSSEGQLKHPYGTCTDRYGNIIVADSGNSRVEMFDKKGRFLKHIVTDLEAPGGVAMAPEGQLVVTCCKNHTVYIIPSCIIYSSQC
ncbi:tripartite motif-containing protein 3-like [Branchiostoma floridae x Branchiostoma belcheri]